MAKKNKDKGFTPASVYGKTLETCSGAILAVQAAVRPFDHSTFRVRAVRILARKEDGSLRMHWANCHQETLPDGSTGNEYVGTMTNIENPNSMVVENEAEFVAKCAASDKPYVAVEQDDWPPCALPMEDGPFAATEEDAEVADLSVA